MVTRRYFGYSIFHAACNRLVSPNLGKALSTEKLNGAGYALRACHCTRAYDRAIYSEKSATDNAKFVVAFEMLEQCFKVGASERNVGIKVTEVGILLLPKFFNAHTNSLDFCRGVPFACSIIANKVYKWVSLGVTNSISSVPSTDRSLTMTHIRGLTV